MPTPPVSAVELFEQLFPTGVRMTAGLLADFEQWAQLTEKLADASHGARSWRG